MPWLCDRNKRRDVFNYLKGKKAHIYCLLDTHFTHSIEDDVLKEWDGIFFFAYKSSSARGVAILFNANTFVVKKTKCDVNGNYVALSIQCAFLEFSLIALY